MLLPHRLQRCGRGSSLSPEACGSRRRMSFLIQHSPAQGENPRLGKAENHHYIMAANSFRFLHLKLFKDVLKNEILGWILGEGQPCWGTGGSLQRTSHPFVNLGYTDWARVFSFLKRLHHCVHWQLVLLKEKQKQACCFFSNYFTQMPPFQFSHNNARVNNV